MQEGKDGAAITADAAKKQQEELAGIICYLNEFLSKYADPLQNPIDKERNTKEVQEVDEAYERLAKYNSGNYLLADPKLGRLNRNQIHLALMYILNPYTFEHFVLEADMELPVKSDSDIAEDTIKTNEAKELMQTLGFVSEAVSEKDAKFLLGVLGQLIGDGSSEKTLGHYLNGIRLAAECIAGRRLYNEFDADASAARGVFDELVKREVQAQPNSELNFIQYAIFKTRDQLYSDGLFVALLYVYQRATFNDYLTQAGVTLPKGFDLNAQAENLKTALSQLGITAGPDEAETDEEESKKGVEEDEEDEESSSEEDSDESSDDDDESSEKVEEDEEVEEEEALAAFSEEDEESSSEKDDLEEPAAVSEEDEKANRLLGVLGQLIGDGSNPFTLACYVGKIRYGFADLSPNQWLYNEFDADASVARHVYDQLLKRQVQVQGPSALNFIQYAARQTGIQYYSDNLFVALLYAYQRATFDVYLSQAGVTLPVGFNLNAQAESLKEELSRLGITAESDEETDEENEVKGTVVTYGKPPPRKFSLSNIPGVKRLGQFLKFLFTRSKGQVTLSLIIGLIIGGSVFGLLVGLHIVAMPLAAAIASATFFGFGLIATAALFRVAIQSRAFKDVPGSKGLVNRLLIISGFALMALSLIAAGILPLLMATGVFAPAALMLFTFTGPLAIVAVTAVLAGLTFMLGLSVLGLSHHITHGVIQQIFAHHKAQLLVGLLVVAGAVAIPALVFTVLGTPLLPGLGLAGSIVLFTAAALIAAPFAYFVATRGVGEFVVAVMSVVAAIFHWVLSGQKTVRISAGIRFIDVPDGDRFPAYKKAQASVNASGDSLGTAISEARGPMAKVLACFIFVYRAIAASIGGVSLEEVNDNDGAWIEGYHAHVNGKGVAGIVEALTGLTSTGLSFDKVNNEDAGGVFAWIDSRLSSWHRPEFLGGGGSYDTDGSDGLTHS